MYRELLTGNPPLIASNGKFLRVLFAYCRQSIGGYNSGMSKTPERFDPAHDLVLAAGIFVREDTGEEEDEDDEEEQPRKHQEDEDDDEDEGYSP